MRIAIFGQYKTGTTALFQVIRNACEPGIRCLFEPGGYMKLPTDHRTGVLAKVILDSPCVNEFTSFERKILITRDPRDWLVSTILFMPQQRRQVYGSPETLDEILQLLRQKETSPSSVSMHRVLEKILTVLSEREREGIEDIIRGQLDFTMAFDQALEGGLKVKYEDFVIGRVTELKRYLGLSLKPRVEVPSEYGHVPRTLDCGNWRTWFTQEDVRFFRPLVSRFMTTQGYPDDWSLESVERLNPDHGSGYVERTVAMSLGSQDTAKRR